MSPEASRRVWLYLTLLVLAATARGNVELEGFGEEDEELPTLQRHVVDSELLGEVGVAREETVEAAVPPSKAERSWDADEFEGFDVAQATEAKLPEGAAKPSPRRRQSIWKKQDSYTKEFIGLGLLCIYLVNVFLGKFQNESIVMSWVQTFAAEGSILKKNFAMVGIDDGGGEEVVMKESHNAFKFYASGRRYCQGLLATMELKARQDLLSLFVYTVTDKRDTLEIDIYMNEFDMGPMVVVMASPKQMKLLQKENEDIRIYAREIPVKQISKWPLDKVNVWTESPDVFYDLMVPEVQNVFLSPEFEAVYGKYFRYIYITSDYGAGSHKRVIKFSFNLPPKARMEELGKLMSLVPLFIDLVAEYVPSQEAKKRAERHRALESERIWKEGADKRKEAFQQKKAEQQQAEMERIRRLSPEEQQKWMEKQQKLKQRRSMKVKTLRA